MSSHLCGADAAPACFIRLGRRSGASTSQARARHRSVPPHRPPPSQLQPLSRRSLPSSCPLPTPARSGREDSGGRTRTPDARSQGRWRSPGGRRLPCRPRRDTTHSGPKASLPPPGCPLTSAPFQPHSQHHHRCEHPSLHLGSPQGLPGGSPRKMEGRRLFNPRALQVQPNPRPSAHKAGLRWVTNHPGAGVRGRGGRAAGGNGAGFGQHEHRRRSAAPIADEGEHV